MKCWKNGTGGYAAAEMEEEAGAEAEGAADLPAAEGAVAVQAAALMDRVACMHRRWMAPLEQSMFDGARGVDAVELDVDRAAVRVGIEVNVAQPAAGAAADERSTAVTVVVAGRLQACLIARVCLARSMVAEAEERGECQVWVRGCPIVWSRRAVRVESVSFVPTVPFPFGRSPSQPATPATANLHTHYRQTDRRHHECTAQVQPNGEHFRHDRCRRGYWSALSDQHTTSNAWLHAVATHERERVGVGSAEACGPRSVALERVAHSPLPRRVLCCCAATPDSLGAQLGQPGQFGQCSIALCGGDARLDWLGSVRSFSLANATLWRLFRSPLLLLLLFLQDMLCSPHTRRRRQNAQSR